MNTHEFFNAVYHQTEENERLEEYKKGLPIGKDEGGNILLAQKREKALMIRNTCVTGAEKSLSVGSSSPFPACTNGIRRVFSCFRRAWNTGSCSA